MCTRAGAGLQQICAGKHNLTHTLLVWRSSVPGAQRCCFSDVTSEDRKIAQLSGNLPLAAYDGAKLRRIEFSPTSSCAQPNRHTQGLLPALKIGRG